MAVHRTGPETARILHRAFETSDADAFFTINSHPLVMRHTGEPPFSSVAAARAAIAGYPDFERYGYGRWACVLKSENRVIGFSGLKYLPELDAVDLGYRFLPEYWGRGLATESGEACVEFGFATLGLVEIIALALPDNPGSIRVLEKLGFSAAGEVEFEGQSGVLQYVKKR